MTHPSAPRRVPLAVLDLVPIVEGGTAAEALADALELARSAERAGYSRFWLAEHHLNPGVPGASPLALLGVLAGATESIRIGTAATLLGNYNPIQVAEAFGTVAQLFGARFDLGLGRSSFKHLIAAAVAAAAGADSGAAPEPGPEQAPVENRVVDGLVIPPSRRLFLRPERFLLQARLLGRSADVEDTFAADVADLLAFFADDYEAADAVAPVHVQPAAGAPVEVWVHGSSAGPSARLAGARGLRFGANYHVAPHAVLDSIAEYRAHFHPSPELTKPYVTVSADVLVSETEEEVRRLAGGYAEWVLSIREGRGAIPYPTPEHAREISSLSDEELRTVIDRLDTRFVGTPEQVVAQLETLQRVTGADELLLTSITHDSAARRRSQELLADAWFADGVNAPTDSVGLGALVR